MILFFCPAVNFFVHSVEFSKDFSINRLKRLDIPGKFSYNDLIATRFFKKGDGLD